MSDHPPGPTREGREEREGKGPLDSITTNSISFQKIKIGKASQAAAAKTFSTNGTSSASFPRLLRGPQGVASAFRLPFARSRTLMDAIQSRESRQAWRKFLLRLGPIACTRAPRCYRIYSLDDLIRYRSQCLNHTQNLSISSAEV